MAGTRIYAVAGAKGGVGKTTTSINLGTSLAARGARTVVVELDLAMANLVDFLALDTGLDDAPTVHDVLAGRAAVTETIRSVSGGLDVVPSGVDLAGYTAADVEALPALLEPLLGEYDRIVLDTGAGLSRETVVPLGLADEAILVSTPRVAAVRDVEKTNRLAERVGTDVAGVVFTKSGTGQAPPPAELAEFLGVELLGHVPEDAAVPASQDVGEPVVVHASDSEAATAYQRIGTTLDKRAVQAATDGERSLELPHLDAIDGRRAAEGQAVEGRPVEEQPTGDTGAAAGGEADPDGWEFGDDPAADANGARKPGAEERDGHPSTATAGQGVSDDAIEQSVADEANGRSVPDEATASDGGTVEKPTTDDRGTATDSDRSVFATGDEQRTDGEADGSLAQRAKSLLGL
ncbi:MAG: P-loop NTPase [Haloarculaceae archaeon]